MANNNPLVDIFGERARKVIYAVWTVVLVMAALQFVFTSGVQR